MSAGPIQIIHFQNMREEDLEKLDWKSPWQFEKSGLEKELAKEISTQHPLHEVKAIAVARRVDNDDVLFFLPNHHPRLAIVHLTWKREASSDWPRTVFVESLTELATRINKDSNEG